MGISTCRLAKKQHWEGLQIGGVAGDWLIPQDAPDDLVILFLHGGGVFLAACLARLAPVRATVTRGYTGAHDAWRCDPPVDWKSVRML